MSPTNNMLTIGQRHIRIKVNKIVNITYNRDKTSQAATSHIIWSAFYRKFNISALTDLEYAQYRDAYDYIAEKLDLEA